MKRIKKSKSKSCFKFQVSSFKNNGFIFLEVVIAIALIGIVLITLLGIGFTALNVSASLQQQNQAHSLAREEMEAVRAFRDSTAATWTITGIGSLTTGSNYYMVSSSSPASWSTASGSETVGSFTRKVVFDKAYRDGNGNLAASGTEDIDARKITVTLSWGTRSYQLISYLTNWQK